MARQRGGLEARPTRWARRLVLLGVVLLAPIGVMLLGAGATPPAQASGGYGPSRYANRVIPPYWLQLTQAKGAEYGIDWTILAAIASIESNFNRPPCPVSSAGAKGPMQFMPGTWDQYGLGKDICDPVASVDATARYLVASGAPGDYARAVYAYNHASWYVDEVLSLAARYRGPLQGVPSGPAQLSRAVTVYRPRTYALLPPWAMAFGRAPEVVDARILDDVLWVLKTYNLRVNAAREAGHHTHGDGTALDLRPATGNDQGTWDNTALRLAHDLGWTESCAASGVAPVCPLVPAIRGVFYNGYGGHGDPAHVGGSAHIHVSWYGTVFGNSGLVPPNPWVRAFPVPST